MRPTAHSAACLFAYSDLYPGTPEPVAFRFPAPFYVCQKDVRVDQAPDKSLRKNGWVWFVGPELQTARVA
ncbi:MAG TPA: hypothetical protein VJN18_32435 [Polyangiaceae bacterium]|nr:hypothetical protein [Polyangiaceae bacterium]